MQIVCLFVLLLFEHINSTQSPLDKVRFRRQAKCEGAFQYRCKNGQCIESFSVCDGETNCSDGSDETQAVCSKMNIQCPSFAFRCTYGACVDKSKKCNGVKDCADNSDELLPECVKPGEPVGEAGACINRQFKCLSGQCVDEFAVCDGYRDCHDGSDETITQCVNIRCPDYSFQCAYGACLDANKKCNGVDDCSDASDEDEELCASDKKPPPRPNTTTTPRPRPPTSSPRGGCILPDYPDGGRYHVKVCAPNGRCTGGPGSLAPSNSVLTYECSKGYVLTESGRNIFCFTGVWEPEPPKCLKQCKPLVSDSMDIECIYRGDPVRCDRPINPGTKVRPRCKTGYRLVDASLSFKETECLPDGTWEVQLFKCVPECGKPNVNAQTLISYGEEAPIAEYPWHAGLYLRIKGVWEHVCGGTIISPYIILTAAHCVYDEGSENVRNARDMRVAVGKFRRSWDKNDQHEQRLEVKEVIPQRYYRGKTNSYEQDIAVLDLEKSIVLSMIVMPVCVDWLSEGTFYVGMLGTVVGWGRNEDQVPTATLQVARLPYYDYDSCRKESPSEFLRFITYDKFCAGYSNGTGVQPGDSGGGLTFVRNKQHFVYGIVSLKLRDVNTFSAFTNVTQHVDWLSSVVKALKPHHTN